MKSVFYPVLFLGLALSRFCATAQNNANTFYYAPLPLSLPDLYTGSITMLVSGADHDTLGQNGQGVCRVYLGLKHDYIGDLNITLTAPNGQSVRLIGPVSLHGATDRSTWNVAFTRCNTAAQPDPGKWALWSSNQPWGTNQHYTGTYYPFSGCLEQLTGPVNGAWTLHITDALNVDVGMLTSFGIEFCDSSNMVVNSCSANAGALTQTDLVKCIGDNLNLNLSRTYTAPNIAPDAALYDYKYTISRTSDDVLLGYLATTNLSTMGVGAYTICGISYPEDGDTLLPVPDGSLTTAQLRNVLNSGVPPFCGDVTSNCVNVLLKPEQPDTIVFDTLCAPQCRAFFGSFYCQPGTYQKTVYQNGCPYTATLKLTVIYPVTYNVRDTICLGDCSVEPGFANACTPGVHVRTLPAVAPDHCDTTIRLTLYVLDPLAEIIAPTTVLDCNTTSLLLTSAPTPGPFIRVWTDLTTGITKNTLNYTVTHPGTYTMSTTKKSTNGAVVCTKSDTILITQAPPIIPVTASADTLGCGDTLATLHASTTWPNLNYHWTGPGGFTSTQKNPVTDTVGTYVVAVTNNLAGCLGRDTVVMVDITDSAFVHITTALDTLTCTEPSTILSAHTNIPNAAFSWDSLVMPPNVQHPVVDQAGIYTVVATSPYMLCTTTASISIAEDKMLPVITLVELVQPTAGHSNGEINIDVSGAPGPYTYVWKLLWTVIGDWQDLYNIPAEDDYSCMVTAANGCQVIDSFILTNRPLPVSPSPLEAWNIRPNPSSGQFLLRTDATVLTPVSLSVYDGNGRVVWQQEAGARKEVEIDLREAPEGLYFLEIQDGAQRLWRKVLVQR